MSAFERFIRRNGQRRLRNMHCPTCSKIMLGPLSRYVLTASGQMRNLTIGLICGACRQPFECAANKIQYAQEQ